MVRAKWCGKRQGKSVGKENLAGGGGLSTNTEKRKPESPKKIRRSKSTNLSKE